jgi:methionine biosynthesis protein MetW
MTAPLAVRQDFAAIRDLVDDRARVLDVGCGEGDLLDLLVRERRADARGLEISPRGVSACLARGLSVMQGDADRDLADFPSRAFDYVILSQTLQAVLNPRQVLLELLRIGERAIVSLPNFGHWRVRLDLLVQGRMPVTGALPEPWWSTPNIHLCTIRDFLEMASGLGLRVEACFAFADGRPARAIRPALPLENWRAESALFLLARPGSGS